MSTIVSKELRELLYSGKYLFLLLAATVLVCLSVVNGVIAYQTDLADATEAQKEINDNYRGQYSYENLFASVVRFPSRLAIFDPGVSGYVGRRYAAGSQSFNTTISDSRYTTDPVLTLFGELSLTTTVGLILSLFALLLSYNAVSGEKEAGTLKQMLSNPLPRSSVILGKVLGGLAPLALLFIIPFMLALLGVSLFTGIQFSGEEWLRISGIAAASLLYLTLFYMLGLAASAVTASSFVSFLTCLVIWLLSVAILPKIAVQTAASISPTMPRSEYSRKLRQLNNEEQWERIRAESEAITTMRITFEQYDEKMEEVKKAVKAAMGDKYLQAQKSLFEEYRNRREALVRTTLTTTRMAPTACYQILMHHFIGTGPELLARFEDDCFAYNAALEDYSRQMTALHGGGNGRRVFYRPYEVTTGPDGYATAVVNPRPEPEYLDVGNLPQFALHEPPMSAAVASSLPDLAILSCLMLAVFAAAFVAFLRYDVR